MSLVFVHGVNVRKGALYERELAFRNRQFVDIFYKQLGKDVEPSTIFNPYWGDLGASLSPELPFLPRGAYELLWRKTGQEAGVAGSGRSSPSMVTANSESEHPLLDVARTASMEDVIDLLWEMAEREMLESGNEADYSEGEMEALAQRALDFAHSEEGERWLDGLKTDEELLERLSTMLHSRQATDQKKGSATADRLAGIIKSASGRLHEGLTERRQKLASQTHSIRMRLSEDLSHARFRLREKLVSTTAHMINDPLRAIFHEQCALLIGDAFAYFSSRGDETVAAPIAARVIDSLQAASELARKSGEQLIVIGHSMGGVILCDVVTCYGKNIPIDVLITVGSQFPLFADLRMFPGVNDAPRPIPKPDNVKRWINIFDPHDFLGYPASHLFSGVDDFHLPTYAIGASAHTNYFNRRSFYFHLARRMLDYMAAEQTR